MNPNFSQRSFTECGGSISDRVWYDTNCNGLQDAGEPRAAGVTVRLYLCDGDVLVGEKITDVNGNYTFGGILPNSYYVIFTAPAGYDFSPAFVGTDRTIDSDPDANGKTPCIVLDCDKNIRTIDAGLCQGEVCDASVGNLVWFDVNCNGIQDKEELGIPGVTVSLYTCAGAFIDDTTTDANGGYLFDGLAAGSYKVCIDIPEAMGLAPKNAGANDALDSDANEGGCTDCFTLEECEDRTDIDFGLCDKPEESLGCRVTGGGTGSSQDERYTMGGQAGANTALQPQPAGEWEHNNHSGNSGSFAFHGGTHSAPDGTEIDRIECSDPGFCNPARPAPAKQIDFWGVGIFHNLRNPSDLFEEHVVEGESLHWFEVNIDDGGEPGRAKVVLEQCPSDGFGLHGSQEFVNCDCSDFYRITIHATTDPSSPVIYQIWSYFPGGNFQIHPLTGFDSH